jgi:hypothetical protein
MNDVIDKKIKPLAVELGCPIMALCEKLCNSPGLYQMLNLSPIDVELVSVGCYYYALALLNRLLG